MMVSSYSSAAYTGGNRFKSMLKIKHQSMILFIFIPFPIPGAIQRVCLPYSFYLLSVKTEVIGEAAQPSQSGHGML